MSLAHTHTTLWLAALSVAIGCSVNSLATDGRDSIAFQHLVVASVCHRTVHCTAHHCLYTTACCSTDGKVYFRLMVALSVRLALGVSCVPFSGDHWLPHDSEPSQRHREPSSHQHRPPSCTGPRRRLYIRVLQDQCPCTKWRSVCVSVSVAFTAVAHQRTSTSTNGQSNR